ncbi:MAG: glutamine amidotransferase [Armatimonadota bacterium]
MALPLVSFSHPWYLLLLPLLGAGAVYVARQSLAGMAGSRARWSLGLRIAILTCAVLALAGLQVRQPTRKLAVLFVLDQSDSIPPAQKRQAVELVNRAASKMKSDDLGGVLVFGGDAYVERETGPALTLKQVHSVTSRDYTNVAGAIRLALAAFPDDAQRRLVLVSDGNENLGSAVQEAAAAASAEVQIDVVPVTYEYPREVLLEKMVNPSEAKVGEPFEVRLIARSTVKTSSTINLLRNGELIARQRVDLLPGPNVVTFKQALEESRFHTYEAVIETGNDELAENNRALGFVLVKGKPKVLIVESNPADARYLAASLQGQQLEVDIREPGRLPATLAEFQTYDSIVLSNVGAYQLTPDQMKAIRSSVRDLGTGLVMIGGENSYGPGAYKGTPIEEALPVDMDVRKHKVMPVGAVAMVLHTCEFPDGNRWAAETAASVVDVLGERDKVGVLLYGMSGEQWGLPMQPAANKERIKAQIYNLDPGDAPDFHSLMDLGHKGLMTDASEAAVKHMIIISDGDPSPPTPELLNKIRKDKITVSTVAVFPHGGGTGTLENIAAVGKGQFYNVRRPEEIPRIFLKEAQRVLKPAIIEETFSPNVLRDSQLLSGIQGVPPLMGYVATTAKEAPSVEVAMTSKRDDPILASWRFGLGKSVAFMSDAKNRWAAPWVSAGTTFSRFWAQTIRWTVRSTARANLDANVEIAERKGRVVIDVVDPQGNFINMLDIRGSVAGDNVSPSLRIDQTAPGRYEGTFEAPEKGQYMVALRYTDKDGTPRIHRVGAAVPYSNEYRNLSANTATLTTVSERTGGRLYPPLGPERHEQDLTHVWRHDRRSHTSPQDLWPWLVLLGALLLPVDIGVRRLMMSRTEWLAIMDQIHAATFGKLGGGRTAEKVESTNRLLGAKARAAGRITEAPAPEAGGVTEPAAAPAAPEAPARPRYEGPARKLPTVEGASTVSPAPGASAARTGPLPEIEIAAPTAAAPVPSASTAAAEKAPEPAKPAAPKPAEPPRGGGVVWHKPVPGVDPAASSAPTPPSSEQKKPEAPAADGDGDGSTSRLLKAKRRARDQQE